MYSNQVKSTLGYVKMLELLHGLNQTFSKKKRVFKIADTATCANQTGHHFVNVVMATNIDILSHD